MRTRNEKSEEVVLLTKLIADEARSEDAESESLPFLCCSKWEITTRRAHPSQYLSLGRSPGFGSQWWVAGAPPVRPNPPA
jgi:hypothetical protein